VSEPEGPEPGSGDSPEDVDPTWLYVGWVLVLGVLPAGAMGAIVLLLFGDELDPGLRRVLLVAALSVPVFVMGGLAFAWSRR
jgi:hypothetical protein